jgi:hypothetical protein
MPSPYNKLPEDKKRQVDEVVSLTSWGSLSCANAGHQFGMFTDKKDHLDSYTFSPALLSLGFKLEKPRSTELLRQYGTPPENWQATAVEPNKASCHPTWLRVYQQDWRDVAADLILNRDPMEEIDQTFALFSNGTGRITWQDLKRVCEDLDEHIEDEQLKRMVELFDETGKGYVDQEEFRKLMLQGRT